MMFVLLEMDGDDVTRVFGPFDTEEQAIAYLEKHQLFYAYVYPITETPNE